MKKNLNDIKRQIAQNKKDGFVPLSDNPNHILGAMAPLVNAIKTNDINALAQGTPDDPLNAGPFAIRMGKTFAEPAVTIVTKDEENVPGNGAVGWGVKNTLPAYIYKTSKCLPYTAQGLEYQTNASVGIRTRFVYKYCRITNGILTEHTCDFHLAGKLLLSQIRKLRQQIKEEQATGGEGQDGRNPDITVFRDNAESATVLSGSPAENNSQLSTLNSQLYSYRTKPEPYTPTIPLADVPDTELDSLNRELDTLIKDYREWCLADMEMCEFEKNNDLAKLFSDLAQDDLTLDFNFPIVGLQQGSSAQWESPEWRPKITRLSFSPAVITRLEKKGEDGTQHWVYANEKWRYHRTTRMNYNAATIAIPMLRWQYFHDDLNEAIEAEKKKKGNRGKTWNAWYCIPNKHLSNEQEYYTFPAWWSIYPSLAFNYATTLMFDKSVARQNDISFRRIIYVDRMYLENLYADDERGQKPEGRKEIRQELEKKVNDFLSHKSNTGKTLLVDSTISDDGHTLVDSIRVVTLPETNQSATEDEIHAISSVLFYALGLDPRLVGAVPGKQNSSSGTQARELELLNQKKLVQRKQRQKRLLLFVAHHNQWCPEHIDVVIDEQTLSTLDASHTGIVETET